MNQNQIRFYLEAALRGINSDNFLDRIISSRTLDEIRRSLAENFNQDPEFWRDINNRLPHGFTNRQLEQKIVQQNP